MVAEVRQIRDSLQPASTNLASMMRQGIPAPRVFRGLLYSGRLHTISGPPEAGKTVVSLWLAIQAMQAGARVLMLDEENGGVHVGELLQAMGADPDVIEERLEYHEFLGLTWRPDSIGILHDMVHRFRPRLVIFDSCAELMAAADWNENDAGDVTRFFKTVLRPLPELFGCAVWLIDHDGKFPASRYARGSTAKLAAVDVAFKLEALAAFTQSSDGLLRLQVTKDRGGYLERTWRVRVRHQPLSLEFSVTDGGEEDVRP